MARYNSHRINLPGKWLKFMTLLILCHLILIIILKVRNNDYLHCIDERTEEKRGYLQRHREVGLESRHFYSKTCMFNHEVMLGIK